MQIVAAAAKGQQNRPTLQRPLGVDFGARRTGLAISKYVYSIYTLRITSQEAVPLTVVLFSFLLCHCSGGFAPRPVAILDNKGRDRGVLAKEIADIGAKNVSYSI